MQIQFSSTDIPILILICYDKYAWTCNCSVGIIGATGAVGEEILGVMEKRSFPASSIKLFASEKSAGKVVHSAVYGDLVLQEFTFEEAAALDVVLLAVGGDFSLQWGEKLAAAG